LVHLDVEYCYNVLPSLPSSSSSAAAADVTTSLSPEQTQRLEWLLTETFEPNLLRRERSFFEDDVLEGKEEEDEEKVTKVMVVLEYGPRMTFTSAFSSNATSICQACDIPIARLELSKRYRLHIAKSTTSVSESTNSIVVDTTDTNGTITTTTTTTTALKASALRIIHSILHDRMTQELYETPLVSFDSGIDTAQPTRTIPIMEQGRAALELINDEMGLGFDDFDLNYYTELFQVRFLAEK
jgi:phosphoribosylformylglycinamidine synthase